MHIFILFHITQLDTLQYTALPKGTFGVTKLISQKATNSRSEFLATFGNDFTLSDSFKYKIVTSSQLSEQTEL